MIVDEWKWLWPSENDDTDTFESLTIYLLIA